MATLALAAAGAAVGGALLPTGVTLLGATLSGAAIGAQMGALAGGVIDQALLAASGQTRASPAGRLSDLRVMVSGEGNPIPRIYGRTRVGGQVIWATDFEEEVIDDDAGGSGKGGRAPAAAAGSHYRYVANFAVALCEGPITGLGRIWADGKELALAGLGYRFNRGDEDQQPDALIVVKEGAGNAPAYRGMAYVVFERLDLTPFGNRLPQLSFEVFRAVDDLESQIRAVTIIPGAGEFVYEPTPVRRDIGLGVAATENTHTRLGGTDWSVSVDQLQEMLPNVGRVSLFVSWFGSDLRAGHCQLRPCVDSAEKETSPLSWSAAGLTRSMAPVVSRRDGRPAYGGTPSDASVIAAILDLKQRGLSVTLSPFPLMDVPAGNALPDPYGASEQAAYPWRGRVTVHPAPGLSSSADTSPAAAAEIEAFVGTASLVHFALDGPTVVYSGPDEWSYRRMVLHNAYLALAAGGVDTFVIGSEMRGLTQARGVASSYPFVAALVALAADVKSLLGPATKVTYAADWSEYFGHHPDDGSGDVHFNLDPLWASAAIDAVGIDAYWPLSDWRASDGHLDAATGAVSPHDIDYLKSNVFGGEGYDWYYASTGDRVVQTRTPITDGIGKPWVYRFKDIRSWWSHPHYDRLGGLESTTPSSWLPRSKPIWLMEVGCPAVDLGSNQPNVFVDPKSAESAFPFFSSGVRDDDIQRRYLRAIHETFDPTHSTFEPAANPVSEIYGGHMIPTDRITAYTWDARPFPAFPAAAEVWGDAANWPFGHWLSGRMGNAPLAGMIAAILVDYGFADFDVSAVHGSITGYAIERIQSARDALQQIELSQFVDAFESGGVLRFVSRGSAIIAADVAPAGLVETKPGAALLDLTRQQETELPASTKVSYIAASECYRQAVAEARRSTRTSDRVATADLALVLDSGHAERLAETWLYETWNARERAVFTLPPSMLALEPADLVRLHSRGRDSLLRITDIDDGAGRRTSALGVAPAGYGVTRSAMRAAAAYAIPPAYGIPEALLLDLPAWRADISEHDGFACAFQAPWPKGVAVYRSPATSGFTLAARLERRAVLGTTLTPLAARAAGRWDRAGSITVRLQSGTLASAGVERVLEGANAAGVARADGSWEVIQFQSVELIAPSTYRLSNLLRGQAGSDGDAIGAIVSGAKFALLDDAVTPLGLDLADIGRPLNWRYGPVIEDIGSANYSTRAHAFVGRGLRPLSPVHIRGARGDGGDLAISWVRRTRKSGDSWDIAEVPLSEESERYEIDILDPALPTRVVRTLFSAVPRIVYTGADQVVDFGTHSTALPVRVFQLSALVGRGAAGSAII